jgi:murein DD-endopeptidase MepM/ murein hydrolase activator NlpD
VDGTVRVIRPFDPPATPYAAGHRGVDLAAGEGSTVRSAGAGIVTFAGVLAGRGVVAVTHRNGLRTTYEPLTVGVHQGATVNTGAVLGTVVGGHPGCGAGGCLHWGLLRGKTYLDPLTLLRSPAVRLLPLKPGDSAS